MKKHIFGATSSPSCANFCLKKTATLNQEDFDTETVRTVDKNMYVDENQLILLTLPSDW